MFFLISPLSLSNTKCDSTSPFTAGCLCLTFLVGQYAFMHFLYKVLLKNKQFSIMDLYVIPQHHATYHHKPNILSLFYFHQFILLKFLYSYLENNWEHCLILVFKHMGMFQKLHIKKSDILVVT